MTRYRPGVRISWRTWLLLVACLLVGMSGCAATAVDVVRWIGAN